MVHLSACCEKVPILTAYNFGITKLKFLIRVVHEVMENLLGNVIFFNVCTWLSFSYQKGTSFKAAF